MSLYVPDFPSDGWVVLGAKKSKSREEDSDAVSDTLSLISIKTSKVPQFMSRLENSLFNYYEGFD